jgi:hypothetical protein
MVKRETLRTDVCGMLFSCMFGGERTIPSWTQNFLSDMKLRKKLVNGLLTANDQEFGESCSSRCVEGLLNVEKSLH